jgi:ParB/Sulfiredoxin domain
VSPVSAAVKDKTIGLMVSALKQGGLTHDVAQKLAEGLVKYAEGNAEALGKLPGDVPLTQKQLMELMAIVVPPPKATKAAEADGAPRLQGSSIDEGDVLDYLQEHYPNADIGWVRRCLWAADNVLLDDVNWQNRPGGVDQDKVDDMSAKLQDGWQPKPVVVIAPDEDSPMEVADGYHRFAAYDDAGIDAARAWVATPKPGNTGWQADVQAMQWSANNWKPPDKGKALTKGEVAALHKAGNPEALREWYNEGADGQIDWGSPGDFDACVSVASQYIDDAEGFCNLRHQDATGEPPGKAPGEQDKTIRTLPPDLAKLAEPGDRLDDDETGERWLIKAVRGNQVWVVKYSDDQARDDHGRWLGGGGDGPSPSTQALMASRPDQLGDPRAEEAVKQSRMGDAAARLGDHDEAYFRYSMAKDSAGSSASTALQGALDYHDAAANTWDPIGEAATAAVGKYSPDQPRDSDGKFGSGGGSDTAANTARDLASRMNAGQTIHLNSATLEASVDTWAKASGSIKLQNATVGGAGNQNLFTVGNLGISRVNMPQVPGDSATIGKFEDLLRADGVKYKEEDVDPRSLKATQSEMDGRKVAQITESLRASGGVLRADGATLVVSQDGHILDGHHRWGAADIYAVAHPDEKVHVVRVNEDIRPLLNQANQFDDTQGIAHQAFASTAGMKPKGAVPGDDWNDFTPRPPDAVPPDPDKPYMWLGDHWVLLIRDTDDGVPRSLT